MKEKKLSVYGLICGLHNRIWELTRFSQKMWSIQRAGAPKYEDRKTVKHWFHEWNTRGKVISWEIKQFFHKDDQTIVEWYFKNEMTTGGKDEFDGISLIKWTTDNKIRSLTEFGCNLNNYNPYQNGDKPQFRDEKISWF